MSQASLLSKSTNASSPQLQDLPKRPYYPHLVTIFENPDKEHQWVALYKSADRVKPVVSSLGPDREAMTTLGITTEVINWFKDTSLDIENVMGLPMYKNLVYEFIASFNLVLEEGMLDENSAWAFRIQNQNFKWSRKEVSARLGFPLFGAPARATLHQRFLLWERLTGLDHFGTYSSPYSLKCKAWRYVHRLIATNVNCKPETMDYVTIDDLNIMWALEQEEPIDWFDVFSERFLKMQNLSGTLNYVGCTSLITFIAKLCGLEFYCHPDENRVLDHACLKKLRLLAREVHEDTPPTDVSEEEDEEEDIPQEPKEKGENSTEDGKKRKAVADNIESIIGKVPWNGVRRVTVYEF